MEYAGAHDPDVTRVCYNCHRSVPIRYVEFYENMGALVVRYQRSFRGQLCRDCVGPVCWQYTRRTLIFGWWGIISFFVTPVFLINNCVRYLWTLSLPRPR